MPLATGRKGGPLRSRTSPPMARFTDRLRTVRLSRPVLVPRRGTNLGFRPYQRLVLPLNERGVGGADCCGLEPQRPRGPRSVSQTVGRASTVTLRIAELIASTDCAVAHSGPFEAGRGATLEQHAPYCGQPIRVDRHALSLTSRVQASDGGRPCDCPCLAGPHAYSNAGHIQAPTAFQAVRPRPCALADHELWCG